MKEFFIGNGVVSPSAGLFGLNHILWIVGAFVFIVAASIYANKNKTSAKVLLIAMAVVMLVLRAVKYLVMHPFYWSNTFLSSIPYQLCTILSYVLPFTVFFNTKKLNKFIYPLAIIGGFITILYPDWVFNGRGLNFDKLESLIVHILLIAIPVVSTYSGRFKYNIKELYKPIAAMTLLVLYALIANLYITPGSNHMFMMRNPLPINFGPVHHYIVFTIAFLFVLFLMYLPSFIRQKRGKQK